MNQYYLAASSRRVSTVPNFVPTTKPESRWASVSVDLAGGCVLQRCAPQRVARCAR